MGARPAVPICGAGMETGTGKGQFDCELHLSQLLGVPKEELSP